LLGTGGFCLFISLSVKFAALPLCLAVGRDGLKGSCHKFGLQGWIVRLWHVPCSEGTVRVGFTVI